MAGSSDEATGPDHGPGERPGGTTLTVAVTGPTGTFGHGLVPLLEADDRVGRIVGIARSPFDPDEFGWSKMTYRRGDVRDPDALAEAFDGADVVVHLAFLITGTAGRGTTRAINVDGTLNTFRAAADAGARRFVYASSVAAYGFHADNPIGMDENWPARPARRLFYAQEKAELEQLLADEAEVTPRARAVPPPPPDRAGPARARGEGPAARRAAAGRPGRGTGDRRRARRRADPVAGAPRSTHPRTRRRHRVRGVHHGRRATRHLQHRRRRDRHAARRRS